MSRVMSTPTQPQQAGTRMTTPTPTTGMPTHEQIAMRAFEKWCKRGRPHGTDKQDWMEAEMELKKEMMMRR